jgi:serine/threonine-protein kinase HipA
MKHVSVIEVRVWGQRVGAVALDDRLGYYAFAYEPQWRRTGIELVPLTLPLNDRRTAFVFPNLPKCEDGLVMP